jgi:hypothetical protein
MKDEKQCDRRSREALFILHNSSFILSAYHRQNCFGISTAYAFDSPENVAVNKSQC